MPKIEGGLRSCWRQTARKLGTIQERKKPCKNGMFGWRSWQEGRKEKNGRIASAKGESDDQECGRQCGVLHKITKPAAWRGGAQILKREEEDARLLDRCEAKSKEWAKQ